MLPQVIVLLLALSACARSTQWSVTHLEASDPSFRCSKLTYHKERFDLTFHSSEEKLSLYLNLHQAPCPECDQTIVTLSIDNEEMTFVAEQRRGGQRFEIPEATTLALIDALLQEKRIKIFLPGYEMQIDSKGFAKALRSLEHAFIANALKKIEVF